MNDMAPCLQQVKEDGAVRKEKRQYKKRKHKGTTASQRAAASSAAAYIHAAAGPLDMLSSEDEMEAAANAAVLSDEDVEPDVVEDPFAFRRRIDCNYHAVSGGQTFYVVRIIMGYVSCRTHYPHL